MRGLPLDYDEWAEELGLSGWSYDEVLPYFERSEGPGGRPSEDGSMSIDDGLYYPISEAWLGSAEASGYPLVADFNDGSDRDRVGRFKYTRSGGARSTAADGYLRPIAGRPNLEIRTRALATRILFDRGRASGVETAEQGELRRYRADHEVILAAGAYNSPQILMLSGIGPAEHLSHLGIEVREDLPVGENLQDHHAATIGFETDAMTSFSADTPEHRKRWELDGGGPVSGSVVQVGGFFRTEPGLPAPDIQTMTCASTFLEEGLAEARGDAYTMVVCGTRPFSRGRVRLRTAIPGTKVRVTHNQLSDPRDRESLIRGLRLNMKILRHEPIKSLLGSPIQVPVSESDADLDDFVSRVGQGLYHPCGTCAMGKVLDAELKVIGIEGLRVADASAMPLIPRGNINAAIAMVAEKAASMLLDQSPGRPVSASPEGGAR